MSTGQDRRVGELDDVLDGVLSSGTGHKWWKPWVTSNPDVGGDLFAVVDLLDSTPVLRRSLTDPATPEQARQRLAHGLLDGKVSDQAVTVVAEATAVRWPGSRDLADALEREGVRAVLIGAAQQSSLSEVEDELFRFGRLVDGNPALRTALADRNVPLAVRQTLVDDLLAGKVGDASLRLARRAVAARQRTVDNTLTSYVTLAAEEQNRVVATVTVASPLTPEQTERLQAALTRQVGRDVVLQVVVDPNVLGGVRVELGDEVIEGTVAGRLDAARRLF